MAARLIMGLWACLTIAHARDKEVGAKDTMFDWYKGLKPSKVAYAINCGGELDLVDDSGITF